MTKILAQLRKLSPLMLLLVSAFLAVPSHAQSFGAQDGVGTWTFFVHIDGAPPCQCIQIARFNADGSVIAPANDHFTGAGVGEWQKTGFNTISFAILQNNINAEGSAGGVYVIRGVMTLNPTSDKASGTSTFQILDNSGAVQASGTATFTASKLKIA
jgi:hypothetical protein